MKRGSLRMLKFFSKRTFVLTLTPFDLMPLQGL
jgi:hypothetical protein